MILTTLGNTLYGIVIVPTSLKIGCHFIRNRVNFKCANVHHPFLRKNPFLWCKRLGFSHFVINSSHKNSFGFLKWVPGISNLATSEINPCNLVLSAGSHISWDEWWERWRLLDITGTSYVSRKDVSGLSDDITHENCFTRCHIKLLSHLLPSYIHCLTYPIKTTKSLQDLQKIYERYLYVYQVFENAFCKPDTCYIYMKLNFNSS